MGNKLLNGSIQLFISAILMTANIFKKSKELAMRIKILLKKDDLMHLAVLSFSSFTIINHDNDTKLIVRLKLEKDSANNKLLIF